MRWVIYTGSLSSMLSIKNNRENHPILNQIYDILHNQKNRSHYVKSMYTQKLKEMKKQAKHKKQAIDMLGMTATRPLHHLY